MDLRLSGILKDAHYKNSTSRKGAVYPQNHLEKEPRAVEATQNVKIETYISVVHYFCPEWSSNCVNIDFFLVFFFGYPQDVIAVKKKPTSHLKIMFLLRKYRL